LLDGFGEIAERLALLQLTAEWNHRAQRHPEQHPHIAGSSERGTTEIAASIGGGDVHAKDVHWRGGICR
jgi:hypothetical protein